MACSAHPAYSGRKKPQVHCVECWLTWVNTESERYARLEWDLAVRRHREQPSREAAARPAGSAGPPRPVK
jgi:hypothetical protein